VPFSSQSNGRFDAPAFVCKTWNKYFWRSLRAISVTLSTLLSSVFPNRRFLEADKLRHLTVAPNRDTPAPSTILASSAAYLKNIEELHLITVINGPGQPWAASLVLSFPSLRKLWLSTALLEQVALPPQLQELYVISTAFFGSTTANISGIYKAKSLERVVISNDVKGQGTLDVHKLTKLKSFPLLIVRPSDAAVHDTNSALLFLQDHLDSLPDLCSLSMDKVPTPEQFFSYSDRLQRVLIESTFQRNQTLLFSAISCWLVDEVCVRRLLAILPMPALLKQIEPLITSSETIYPNPILYYRACLRLLDPGEDGNAQIKRQRALQLALKDLRVAQKLHEDKQIDFSERYSGKVATALVSWIPVGVLKWLRETVGLRRNDDDGAHDDPLAIAYSKEQVRELLMHNISPMGVDGKGNTVVHRLRRDPDIAQITLWCRSKGLMLDVTNKKGNPIARIFMQHATEAWLEALTSAEPQVTQAEASILMQELRMGGNQPRWFVDWLEERVDTKIDEVDGNKKSKC
jgi:hypothetical protein